MRTSILAILLLAAASVAACAPVRALEDDQAANAAIAACAVTLPTESAFVPPAPWPAQPPTFPSESPIAEWFWYGDDGLWTALPLDGTWAQLARGEKFWWWSAEFDVYEDSTPDLTLTARRLDGDAPPFQVSEATNGYHENFHWAMLVGIELPSPGCWHFTGRYAGHELQFVLWVPAE